MEIKVIDETNGVVRNRCVVCRRIFESTKEETICSKACTLASNDSSLVERYSSLWNQTVTLCRTCGVPMAIGLGQKTKVYCSPSCREVWTSRKAENVTVYRRYCRVCGVSFSTTDKNNKVCGRLCKRSYLHKSQVVKVCQVCEKRFTTRHINRAVCSETCAKKYFDDDAHLEDIKYLMEN